VARTLTNLAALYCSKGRHAEAEPLFHRALSIAENALGPQNPLVGRVLADYAVLLRKTKRKTEARQLELRAKAIREMHSADRIGEYTVDLSDLAPSRRR
jgi:tetratricopeptide (TPR) repeat protein